MTTLLTVGHGRLEHGALGDLLAANDVELVVDVRRYPGSRNNPAAQPSALRDWLPRAGIEYHWDDRLGGRRPLASDSVDTWWEVDQFRAYASWTRSTEFQQAMRELLGESAKRRTAVMCSESVWWRCHRRLIADVAVLLYEVAVVHVLHDGRLMQHKPALGARVTEDGVVWDGSGHARTRGPAG